MAEVATRIRNKQNVSPFGAWRARAFDPSVLLHQVIKTIRHGPQIVPFSMRDLRIVDYFYIVMRTVLGEDGLEARDRLRPRFAPLDPVDFHDELMAETLTQEPRIDLVRKPLGWIGITVGGDGLIAWKHSRRDSE